MYAQGDQYCKQVTCRKASSPGDYTVTDEDVASKNTEGNVEATKTVCVAKSKIDGTFTDGLDVRGNTTSSGSGTNVIIGEGDDMNIYDENGNIIGRRGSGSVTVDVGGAVGTATMSTGDMCYE